MGDSGDTTTPERTVVLVTGPAGAGRTTVIHALEDIGYEAIDNLPLSLLPRLLDGPPVGPLAVGADPRTRDFSVAGLFKALQDVKLAGQYRATLLYVDCAPHALVRRYSETRRRHPSSPDSEPLVGIEREAAMLAPLRSQADVLIDTTSMTPHDLRAEITRQFGPPGGGGLAITLISFSFKKAMVPGLDMMFDVRFLRNPHWEAALRPLDGRDAPVLAYIAADERWAPLLHRLEDLMRFLLPAYVAEGKSHFTLGIGCTGGRHRSVAAVEALAKALAQDGWRVSIRHRDLGESNAGTARAQAEVVVQ